jgi:hypothetical protein
VQPVGRANAWQRRGAAWHRFGSDLRQIEVVIMFE